MTDTTSTPELFDLLHDAGYSDQEIVEHSLRIVCSAFITSGIEQTFVESSADDIIGFDVQIKPLRDKS